MKRGRFDSGGTVQSASLVRMRDDMLQPRSRGLSSLPPLVVGRNFWCITETILYSVHEHALASSWLCDANHGYILITLINGLSGHK